MNIALVFAMDMEWSPWRARHAFQATRDPHSGRVAYDATIGGSHVRVAVCGVCAPRAAASIAAVCANRGDGRKAGAGAGGAGASANLANTYDAADALIVAGFGGGLRPAYRAGSILAARRVHHHHVIRVTRLPGQCRSGNRCCATSVWCRSPRTAVRRLWTRS